MSTDVRAEKNSPNILLLALFLPNPALRKVYISIDVYKYRCWIYLIEKLSYTFSLGIY